MKRQYQRRYDNRNAWAHLTQSELLRYVESFFTQLVHMNGLVRDLETERLHLERRIARQRGMIRVLQGRLNETSRQTQAANVPESADAGRH